MATKKTAKKAAKKKPAKKAAKKSAKKAAKRYAGRSAKKKVAKKAVAGRSSSGTSWRQAAEQRTSYSVRPFRPNPTKPVDKDDDKPENK